MAELIAAGYSVTGYSLLSFTRVEHEELPACDFVFAYSGTGVRMLNERFVRQLIEQQRRVGAMGPGTAKAWEARGIAPAFVGRGTPDEVARAFSETLPKLVFEKPKPRVVFVQASNSIESIAKALEHAIIPIPLITYENGIEESLALPPCELLVVTSPLNARAALRKVPTASSLRIWSVGPSTSAAVEALGFEVSQVVTLSP